MYILFSQIKPSLNFDFTSFYFMSAEDIHVGDGCWRRKLCWWQVAFIYAFMRDPMLKYSEYYIPKFNMMLSLNNWRSLIFSVVFDESFLMRFCNLLKIVFDIKGSVSLILPMQSKFKNYEKRFTAMTLNFFQNDSGVVLLYAMVFSMQYMAVYS